MYKVEIDYMSTGYYLTVTDVRDNKIYRYYMNKEIGKLLGIDYFELAKQNSGFMEVSAEDLEGNDIEEYWFERLEDCERVKEILEGLLKEKNISCRNEKKSEKDKNYRLINENKMKDYLSERIGYKISEEQFRECVDYFVEYVGYIEETLEDMGKEKKIKEGACLEVEIGKEFVEVWVKYSWVIDGENGKEFVLIGLNYEYVNYFK